MRFNAEWHYVEWSGIMLSGIVLSGTAQPGKVIGFHFKTSVCLNIEICGSLN